MTEPTESSTAARRWWLSSGNGAEGPYSGITEGVIYSVNAYQPAQALLTVYLLRFFGVAFGHAALVLLSTSVLFYWRGAFFDACREATKTSGHFGWCLVLFYLALIALASAIPHGLYDALLL